MGVGLLFGFHVGLGIACLVFAVLGELRLWALVFSVMCFSLAIQFLILRRVVRRQIREELEWMERVLPEIELAVDEYMRANALRRKPDDATRDEMLLLQEEITQAQRERSDNKDAPSL